MGFWSGGIRPKTREKFAKSGGRKIRDERVYHARIKHIAALGEMNAPLTWSEIRICLARLRWSKRLDGWQREGILAWMPAQKFLALRFGYPRKTGREAAWPS